MVLKAEEVEGAIGANPAQREDSVATVKRTEVMRNMTMYLFCKENGVCCEDYGLQEYELLFFL